MKLIIFDLDGVLIDSRDMHFVTLNKALHEVGLNISHSEHIEKYDGHPTTYKLNLLTREKGLSESLHDQIWRRKQDFTQEVILETYTRDDRICEILKELKNNGYLLYCASNAIWATVKNALLRKGFLEYIDYFISNEEIKLPKPNPEIYLECFERANVSPHEVIICEDSPIGRQAAIASGAVLCPIENSNDVTLDKILKCISKIPCQTQVVIPMAGEGSRFRATWFSAMFIC